MPVKPTFGSFLWASDANFTTGPAALQGTATKVVPPAADSDEGWKADQRPPAQWFNYVLNLITQWTDWVRQGDNTGAEDAHVVETSATGRLTAALATITGNVGGSSPSLWLPAQAGGNPTGILITRTGTAQGVTVDQQGTGAAAYLVNSGSGLALLADNRTGTGNAAEIFGASGSRALLVESDGTIANVGANIRTDNGSALRATVDGSQLNPAIGVFGLSTPGRANLWLSDQAEPSLDFAGDLWIEHGSNGFGRGYLGFKVQDGSDGGGSTGRQIAWSTRAGIGYVHENNGSTGSIGGTPVVVASRTLDTGQASPGKPPGIYLVWWSHSVESTVGTDSWSSELRVNSTIVQEDGGGFGAANLESRGGGCYVHLAADSTLYTLDIRVNRNTGSGTLTVDDATIAALGALEVNF